MTRSACAALTAAITCLVLSAPALAAPSCDDRPLPAGAGVMTRTMTMPSSGWVHAKLAGATRRRLGPRDLRPPERQARGRIVRVHVRRGGGGPRRQGHAAAGAGLPRVGLRRARRGSRLTPSPSRTRRREGLDGPRGHAHARPQGPADAARPRPDRARGQGFVDGAAPRRRRRDRRSATTSSPTRSRSRTWCRQDIRDRQADARYAARVRASALPSGRDTYRRLNDYSERDEDARDDNPGLVRPITLNHKTWEGRPVDGHRDHDERERPRRQAGLPPAWASTTRASGPRASTPWSGPTS